MTKTHLELGSKKNEWDTDKLLWINGLYFYVLKNGGSDGSWDSSPLETRREDQAGAIELLISFGYELDEIAEKLIEAPAGPVSSAPAPDDAQA